ncbi:DUF6952 family protein [Ekhidna sp.]
MKIPVIKSLVEQYSKEELESAEAAIADERQPEIEIQGEDEGEQLTHAYAAIQIIQSMEENNVDFKTALREYTSRVRSSIS